MTKLMVLILLFLAPLAACGKKADIRPPDDRAEEFRFPQTMPHPQSVVPAAGAAVPPTAEQREQTRQPRKTISPIPRDRETRTTTYGNE